MSGASLWTGAATGTTATAVTQTIPPDDTEITAALVADAVDQGGQCLAFVRSRTEAVGLAERLAADGLAERLGWSRPPPRAAGDGRRVTWTAPPPAAS